ncbi:MAG: adenylyltransferase/cytidyltransferase family protein [Polyangiaceae bacterium]
MSLGRGGSRTSGMVLGKFMPPHMGHVYLVEFARRYVDDLNGGGRHTETRAH